MLGNHGDGDAIDELLGRIKERAGGGKGAGNNGGSGDDNGGGHHGGGGDGGEDPYSAPATVRMLLDVAKQMANFQSDFTMRTAEKLTEAIVKGREAGQEQLVEVARQLHESNMRTIDASARLAEGAATRLERIEQRLAAIERASSAADDIRD